MAICFYFCNFASGGSFMSEEKKICASETYLPGLGKYKCSRPVWEDGGPDEKFCLFHSEQYEKKKEAFKREINHFKNRHPSEHFLGGKKIKKTYDFIGFNFPDACSDFEGHNFDLAVNFSKATFKGDARFERVTILGNAWFIGVKFINSIRFNETKFKGNTWFGKAEFGGESDFTEAKFIGIADFIDVVFLRDANFYEAVFSGNAWFAEAKFEGEARFDDSEFKDISWFGNSKFRAKTWFWGAKLGGFSTFRNAVFTLTNPQF
jgi:uncharacterized protein YjbI with pentapeptide repeats